jgi:hypothetical protein
MNGVERKKLSYHQKIAIGLWLCRAILPSCVPKAMPKNETVAVLANDGEAWQACLRLRNFIGAEGILIVCNHWFRAIFVSEKTHLFSECFLKCVSPCG